MELKRSTASILAAVSELTTTLTSSMGGVNDRITALNRQINLNDITITQSVEDLKTTTSNLKTIVDKKSNQILNKTASVFEKVKQHKNNVELGPGTDSSESKANGTAPPKAQPNQKPTKTNKGPQPTPKSQQRNQNERKQQNRQETNTNENNEVIDLTKNNKQVIKHETLIIGSSILKNVKTNTLN